jgi:alcohol dehydrogenase (cytochrome c)
VTRATGAAGLLLACTIGLAAQVSGDRLRNAAAEPHNWLTYSGTYAGHRHSTLRQIDPANVKALEMKWMLQNQVFGPWESSPLVVDGIMYLTQRPNDILAVDARTGRIFWVYRHPVATDFKVCCGANNRGLAMLGETLFMGTLDARLVAVDARSGRPMWNVKVAEYAHGYSLSLAPLVVKDKVIVGVGGGEYGIRGFIAAFDPATGKEMWRFNTVPAPGEPGSETWRATRGRRAAARSG